MYGRVSESIKSYKTILSPVRGSNQWLGDGKMPFVNAVSDKNDLYNHKRVSIIVICYTRKEFILDAIQSIKNQLDLTKFNAEIIVIKNFIDKDIDQRIIDLGCVLLTSKEPSIGGKIVEGLQRSTGEIVSFLEDDDLFIEEKLSSIELIFAKSIDNVYVHNMYQAVDYGEKFE